MERKVVRMTPDQLGYKDRGKMKWMGLMLSSHTDALKILDKQAQVREPKAKAQMSEKEISRHFQQAYLAKRPVVIQANVLNNGSLYPDLNAMVLGFQDEDIYLNLKDGRRTTCQLNQIRHIEFMKPEDWFNK